MVVLKKTDCLVGKLWELGTGIVVLSLQLDPLAGIPPLPPRPPLPPLLPLLFGVGAGVEERGGARLRGGG